MKNLWKPLILGISILLSVLVLSFTFLSYARNHDTVSVTGLGETVFSADQIVWQGRIVTDNIDQLQGYRKIEEDSRMVLNYLKQQGIEDAEVTFSFVNVDKNYESVYQNGNYAGSRFKNYALSQTFTITSAKVDNVERISREISSLIAKGVNVESFTPQYYYTGLNDLKLELIEKASRDARLRAENVVSNAGAKLGKAVSARLGVFQITAATGEEEYAYGGTFNTSSREKKARITVRMEYRLK
ncbi:MAG: SIMPL domain-containing protein [Paludibacter sp.]|nr:SIMPL domain-containing protein [Bacteroidales bacterium]MCM1068926.1 SIMPL domain-containing protein [Prevotella sp.]MCM1353187.1 SIMPL domain-containing protein [Bacteroides sp.]MCM1442509.1 SIMPL domain-containing protein [Muribaculum sp.]MCM1481352.1 SIMPL domain-containing protein [Paludibacter sp.]